VLVRGNIFFSKINTYTQTKATTYPFHKKRLIFTHDLINSMDSS